MDRVVASRATTTIEDVDVGAWLDQARFGPLQITVFVLGLLCMTFELRLDLVGMAADDRALHQQIEHLVAYAGSVFVHLQLRGRFDRPQRNEALRDVDPRDVRQRAKQVIWLNPENRMTWGFGDSEMDRYAPYCTLVEECRNLNQLYRVIDHLVTL